MSDLSSNLISHLLLSALRNSVIVLKYLWIWFIRHTWKAVNKIFKSKRKTFCVTTQRYKATKIQGLQEGGGGSLREGTQVRPLLCNSGAGLSKSPLTSSGPWPMPLDFLCCAPSSKPQEELPECPHSSREGVKTTSESGRTDFKSLPLHGTQDKLSSPSNS